MIKMNSLREARLALTNSMQIKQKAEDEYHTLVHTRANSASHRADVAESRKAMSKAFHQYTTARKQLLVAEIETLNGRLPFEV